MRKFKDENAFKRWALAELKKLPNSWFYGTWVGPRRGIPDVMGFLAGEGVALELKLDGKYRDKTRETLQEYNIKLIKEAGVDFALSRVTPSQWQALMLAFKIKVDTYRRKRSLPKRES